MRTRRRQGPSPGRLVDPVARGSSAAASTGSPPSPVGGANREPARPANAKQIASSAAWRPGLRRACRSVNRHVAGFARMIKDLSGDKNTLAAWMGAVDADLPVLRSFTAGLRRDPDAVVAGLLLPHQVRVRKSPDRLPDPTPPE